MMVAAMACVRRGGFAAAVGATFLWLAACGTADKTADTAHTAIGDQARILRNSSVPTAGVMSPCSLNGGSSPCYALLDASFVTGTGVQRWNLWKQVQEGFIEAQPEKRRLDATANSGDNCYPEQRQHARTRVNPDSRNMELETLTSAYVIPVGFMRFKDGCRPADVLYTQTAGPLPPPGPSNDDEREKFVVLAMHDEAAPLPLKASWQLYQILGTGAARHMEPIGPSHFIVKCAKPHKTHPNEPWADFWNCSAEALTDTIATRYTLAFAAVRTLTACDSTAATGCVSDAVLKQRVSIIVSQRATETEKPPIPAEALFLDARRIIAIQDPLTDPYWFSCAAGCCTASM